MNRVVCFMRRNNFVKRNMISSLDPLVGGKVPPLRSTHCVGSEGSSLFVREAREASGDPVQTEKKNVSDFAFDPTIR